MNKEFEISSIIIAKDEEANIGRCIDSQLDCIDEIVVIIDEKSTDQTLEIVKQKNVCYEIYKWVGYAATKQYAISKAKNEWILWIDADESLTPELKKEILEFKSKEPSCEAYSIPRKAYFLGKWIKHSGWYPGRVIRLFNKNKAYFSNKDVHEHLSVNGRIGELVNDLDHWTDPSIEHYFQKFNRYTSLAAKELAAEGKTASLMDIILRPAFLFLKMFFFKAGFLDGLHGFILAGFSSAYVFTKYCKLWELNKNTRV